MDFAMYSMQLAKICLKNVNFKGLKGTWTQKVRIFVAADCLSIFVEFTVNQHFDLIFKKQNLC
jgi:hypothetical protein